MEKNRSVSINPYQDNSELVVLFAGQQQTPPLYKVGPRKVDHYLLHFVVSGKGVFHCREQAYRLEPGSCFLICSGEQVTYESDPEEPWFYRWIGFRGNYANVFLNHLALSPDKPVLAAHQPEETNAHFTRIEEVLNLGRAGCALEAGGLLRILFGQWLNQKVVRRLTRPETAYDKMDEAVAFLSKHFDQPISIDQLARSLGYHRIYFSRMFKKRTGFAPTEYLHKIRMEQAKILLTQPLTIREVASAVGYTDSLFFSNQFKKWCGSNPTEYRQSKNGN